MSRNEVVSMPANTLIELTANDITSIVIEPQIGSIMIYGMPSAVPPTDLSNGVTVATGSIVLSDISLLTMFPGITAVRIFAISPAANKVKVSHA